MTHLHSSEENPYYRWWYSIEKAGVPLQAVTEYYNQHDSEQLFSITFDGEEFTFPILTKDDWAWSTDPYEFDFNPDEKRTNYEWYYITSAVSRMAYAADQVSVNTVEELEEYVWNGELYTVNTVTEDSVNLIQSDFYSILSSAEPYIAELNSFLYNSNISQATTQDAVSSIVKENEFPIRDEHAQTLDDIVSTSSETEFPIGGTYPVILRTEDGFECIVSKRSTSVNSWPEYWTVLPAGYFAPDGIDDRLGVLNQFYSEYCEELFNVEEGTVTGLNDRVRQVEMQMANETAEFAVTGMGVEGVGLSFEVSGVFIVYDLETANSIREGIDSNYEIDELRFLDLDNVEAVKDFLTPDDVTPPSGFAFSNALWYLKEMLPEEEQPESVKRFGQ